MNLWLQHARKLDGVPSRERASAVVLALVDGLNQLDGRYGGMIDTIRREEACDAILDLARRHLFSALTPKEEVPAGLLDQPPADLRPSLFRTSKLIKPVLPCADPAI